MRKLKRYLALDLINQFSNQMGACMSPSRPVLTQAAIRQRKNVEASTRVSQQTGKCNSERCHKNLFKMFDDWNEDNVKTYNELAPPLVSDRALSQRNLTSGRGGDKQNGQKRLGQVYGKTLAVVSVNSSKQKQRCVKPNKQQILPIGDKFDNNSH